MVYLKPSRRSAFLLRSARTFPSSSALVIYSSILKKPSTTKVFVRQSSASIVVARCYNRLMKIYSWNVNGIRAVVKKGELQKFMQEHAPDVLCLQETKAIQG